MITPAPLPRGEPGTVVDQATIDKTAAIAQCTANIQAVLHWHGLPAVVPVTTQTDRLIAMPPEGFVEMLKRLPFSTWNFVRNHGTTAVRGWREDCAVCSMQIVEHSTCALEIDIDLANPNYGLALIVGHTWEVLANMLHRGKTDPFRVKAGLLKSKKGIAL